MLLPEICERYLTSSQVNGTHGEEAFAERARVLRSFCAHLPIDHSQAKPFHLSDWMPANQQAAPSALWTFTRSRVSQ